MMSEEHGGYWLYRLDRIVDILETKKGEKLDYIKRFHFRIIEVKRIYWILGI